MLGAQLRVLVGVVLAVIVDVAQEQRRDASTITADELLRGAGVWPRDTHLAAIADPRIDIVLTSTADAGCVSNADV